MAEQPYQFGRELRRLRLASDLTLAGLGGLVHYSKGQLSKVERGLKPPSLELARLCDAALDASGKLAALVPGETPRTEPAGTRTDDGEDEEAWLMHLSAAGASWFEPIGRRQVMATGAASVLALGLGTPVAPSGAETAKLLDASRSLFDQYRQLGQSVRPGFILPALIAQTHTLRELSVDADSRTRRELLTLGSRYAEYIGWLAQETGNEQAALWWTRRAVELAAAGGDHDLAAYAHVRRALITLYRGDGPQTTGLAQRAQSGGLPPRIRGLAAQREAQGHALSGDYDACMRCLDRARVLFAEAVSDSDAPVLGTTNLSDPAIMITGWCLYDLGRPKDAAEVLDRQMAQVPPGALRTQARYGTRRARAHAAAGEIDHACELIGPLLGAAVAVGSATVATDLRQLARILGRHPRNPSVRALAPELATSLHLVAT